LIRNSYPCKSKKAKEERARTRRAGADQNEHQNPRAGAVKEITQGRRIGLGNTDEIRKLTVTNRDTVTDAVTATGRVAQDRPRGIRSRGEESEKEFRERK
jgi:hypothetical protein